MVFSAHAGLLPLALGACYAPLRRMPNVVQLSLLTRTITVTQALLLSHVIIEEHSYACLGHSRFQACVSNVGAHSMRPGEDLDGFRASTPLSIMRADARRVEPNNLHTGLVGINSEDVLRQGHEVPCRGRQRLTLQSDDAALVDRQ